jgi:hypothetical protein
MRTIFFNHRELKELREEKLLSGKKAARHLEVDLCVICVPCGE